MFTEPAAGVEHARQVACDVGLVDLRLPNVEGAEIVGRLREVSPGTRVIAMCAFPQVEQVLSAIRAGARDVIEKPIQQPALLEALQRQLAEIGIPVRSEQHFNRRLGARIRELRQDGRRTQQEVAERAGITAAQLSQIELGKTATSTWTLARISSALRIPLASLFNGL
jgi:FixJ family two-component response regulator